MTTKERGIFTEADREWIRGERELSEGSEYNTRRRIRKRYQRSIEDLELLSEYWEELPKEDRAKMSTIDVDDALQFLATRGDSSRVAMEKSTLDKVDKLLDALDVSDEDEFRVNE